MEGNLTIKMEDIHEGDSNYCWVNIEIGGARVGKVRLRRAYRRLIIKNINIFPEYERHDYARQTVDLFKETAREIIADRVRDTAKGFWEKMEFSDMGNGNYRWARRPG